MNELRRERPRRSQRDKPLADIESLYVRVGAMTDNQEGWLASIKSSLKKDTAAWVVTFAIGILGVFCSQTTESVRFALNRADLRTKQYEEIPTEISKYIFWAELVLSLSRTTGQRKRQ